MIFRRRPFAELVDRQLDLFVEDDADLLADADAALAVYNAADREEAEEAYGDYLLAVEAVCERLEEIRDAYATTLEDPQGYEAEFEREARRRFEHPLEL